MASTTATSREMAAVAMTDPSVTVKTTSKPDILASARWPTTRSMATTMRKTVAEARTTSPTELHEWKNMPSVGAKDAPKGVRATSASAGGVAEHSLIEHYSAPPPTFARHDSVARAGFLSGARVRRGDRVLHGRP